MNFSKIAAAALSILLSFPSTTSATIAKVDKFRVVAGNISQSNGEIYIKLTVWNCSAERVSIRLANLPWGGHSLGLVAYQAGQLAGDALKESTSIEDYPDKNIELAPFSTTSESINLTSRFPSLKRVRNLDNVVIFWVYDMTLLDPAESKYAGGMVPFSTSRAMPLKANVCLGGRER